MTPYRFFRISLMAFTSSLCVVCVLFCQELAFQIHLSKFPLHLLKVTPFGLISETFLSQLIKFNSVLLYETLYYFQDFHFHIFISNIYCSDRLRFIYSKPGF